MSLLRLWFGLDGRVSQRAYVLSGVLLMALKYLGDGALLYADQGVLLEPLDFITPLLQQRTTTEARSPVLLAMIAWALPFLWIGVSMSVRRAVDAGYSPWLGVLFAFPLLNLLVILVLSLVPSAPGTLDWSPVPPSSVARVRSALLGVAAGVGVALVGMLATVMVFEEYGVPLFFCTPFVMGAVTAYLYNAAAPRTLRSTLGLVLATIGVASGALLLFALEGLLCLLMAFPLAAAAAGFGGLIGRAIAQRRRGGPLPLFLLVLTVPGTTAMTHALPGLDPEPLREVVSALEIDAPPEAVWPHVIGFSELPPPSELFFRLGIAYPQRAVIEGAGVGAVRRCEFSTGAFVEPITRWEPPRRLSFDVVAQPPPMHEWSPYRHVHPPHLDGYLRSRRGEFRLTALPGGRTRLEGSTWYALDLAPLPYWALWSDALIHAIHLRVLSHISALSTAGR
jgi:uncharacterized membrane protein YhaH (DUF805 family)